MNYPHITNLDSDGEVDDSSFYTLASEFLEASRILHDTPPTRLNVSTVTYYLIGHAAELILKAFLFKKGIAPNKLISTGHDLIKLIKLSRENGLPELIETRYIKELAYIYKKKRLEYRSKTSLSFTNFDQIFQEVDRLDAYVFENICKV